MYDAASLRGCQMHDAASLRWCQMYDVASLRGCQMYDVSRTCKCARCWARMQIITGILNNRKRKSLYNCITTLFNISQWNNSPIYRWVTLRNCLRSLLRCSDSECINHKSQPEKISERIIIRQRIVWSNK